MPVPASVTSVSRAHRAPQLLRPAKWTYFYLYVLLDIFSRYVVGWLVVEKESAALAQRLIAESCARQNIEPGQLVNPRRPRFHDNDACSVISNDAVSSCLTTSARRLPPSIHAIAHVFRQPCASHLPGPSGPAEERREPAVSAPFAKLVAPPFWAVIWSRRRPGASPLQTVAASET